MVVVGAGFAGMAAMHRLAGLPVEALLLDRHNYHLFTPLLYQVATAGLEPEEIAQPVRAILHGQRNARFRVAGVSDVDLERRLIHADGESIAYDYLILAAGSTTNFFGNASFERATLGLKDLDEAMQVRNHILAQFEAAVWEADPARRAPLLRFVVVGGGPTGVEFAGALSELVELCLARDYPSLDHAAVQIMLLEAAETLLPGFAPRLQRAALKELRRKRVDVRLNAPVDRIDGARLHLRDGKFIEAASVVWAAGVRAADLAAALPVPHARANRIAVQPTLQLVDHPEVFVTGDLAALDEGGGLLPMLAPVALQEGRHAADNIGRLLAGGPALPFHYHNRGMMATIGRNAAVAQVGPLQVSGFVAWVMWLTLHIVELIGFRNRLLVLVNWIWNYLSYDRAVRLIVGRSDPGP